MLCFRLKSLFTLTNSKSFQFPGFRFLALRFFPAFKRSREKTLYDREKSFDFCSIVVYYFYTLVSAVTQRLCPHIFTNERNKIKWIYVIFACNTNRANVWQSHERHTKQRNRNWSENRKYFCHLHCIIYGRCATLCSKYLFTMKKPRGKQLNLS